ncbi:tol-pal system protein YbgF [Caenispirillum bisanense]|uniref:Cell division coordinator CpoB n=1 Tax=Caenispirillum bisanense TaxID=414052 RepID=A0A286GRN4_9PROT|nr:tol-pal system protein YbgF [Caenispirillum bisanense]SOD97604.1 tol-pal system protein YbgF [Caenispirillum bisanense]
MRSKGWIMGSGRRLAAALLVGASLVALQAPPAAAQDARELSARMERLERDLQVLQRQLYRGEVGGAQQSAPSGGFAGGGELSGDMAARLQQRLIQIEELVTKLTGRVEENQYQVQQLSSKVDRFVDDIDFRLQELEKGGGAAATAEAAPAQGQAPAQAAAPAAGSSNSAANPGLAPGQGTLGTLGGSAAQGQGSQQAAAPAGAALPAGAPEEQYKYAFGLLRKNDYPSAAKAFEAFLAQHPKHDLAGNAQYWLGETYYVQNSFDKAAVAFLEGYRTYPKNSKAPDNLLKLGLTMANLKKDREACAAFGRIGSEYPQAPDAIKRRAQSESQRLNCGAQ